MQWAKCGFHLIVLTTALLATAACGRETPEAKVKVTPVPWDGAHNKIANAIAAGQTPDISLVGTTWMGEFVKTGQLQQTPSSFDRNAFFPGLWATTEVGGRSYGAPWYADTRALFYRKDMAEKAGVKPPATWDELKSFAQALRDKGGAPHGIYLQAAGTSGLSANDRVLPGQIEADFVDGKIGSFISGSYHRSLLTKQGGAEFESKYGVVELPKGDSAAGFAGGGDLVVFKGAKNSDGAWKFIRYLSRPDVQAEWFVIQADPPAVQAAWQDQRLAGDEKLQVFARQLHADGVLLHLQPVRLRQLRVRLGAELRAVLGDRRADRAAVPATAT